MTSPATGTASSVARSIVNVAGDPERDPMKPEPITAMPSWSSSSEAGLNVGATIEAPIASEATSRPPSSWAGRGHAWNGATGTASRSGVTSVHAAGIRP